MLLLAAIPSPLLADGPDLSGSVSIGGEFDSNVSVDEADLNTRRGDEAVLLAAGLNLELLDTPTTTFELGYDFDQSLHKELTAFDLQIHGISASATQTLGPIVFGLDARYRRALLGGDDYLSLSAINPSATWGLADNMVLRAAYIGQQKTYLTSTRLDAWNDQAAVDLYRYFARRRGFVVLSLRYDHEDAAAEELDYRAWQAGIRGQAPITVGAFRARVRLGYAYSDRDYSAVTPSIGEKRREHRSTMSAAVDFPVTTGLTLRPAMRLVDRDSNLPSFDYTEEVFSAEWEYRF